MTRAVTRAVLAAPAPVRQTVLAGALARAQDAFNRGDLEAIQRTARLRHRGAGEEPLEYEVLQRTEIRGGSVVRQTNELR